MFSLWGGQHIKDFPQRELIADNVNIKLNITKATTIKLIFIKTTATMRNVFGYYTYPTGQEPKSVSDIQPIIAFPFISTFNCNIDNADAVFTGDQVQLKYWNARTQRFEDEFPAGVSIGWFLDAYSFDPDDRDGTGGQYSCLLCFTRVEPEQHAPFDRAGRPAERTYAGDRFRGQRYHRGG